MFYAKTTVSEMQMLQNLKGVVSNETLRACNHSGEPDIGQVSAVLTGLQHSIEQRTIGLDGWPLRGRQSATVATPTASGE